MNTTDELQAIIAESKRLVATVWTGQFDLPTTKGTVHEVIDSMFLIAATTAAMLDGRPVEGITAPFVYGWVPVSEVSAAFDSLLAAASRADASAERLLHLTASGLDDLAAALTEVVPATTTAPNALVGTR